MLATAKDALDKIISKGRVHFYKPIQIAEILYPDRNKLAVFDLDDLDSYRNASKHWRDAVTMRLVGRVSTSSQKYQDNLFEANAIPPHFLTDLAEYNRTNDGVIESYIYYRFKDRQQDVLDAFAYLENATTSGFSLGHFLSFFERRAGLKRSVDKAFEIVVYALFLALVRELKAMVTLSLDNPNDSILKDFDKFVSYVLGLQAGQHSVSVSASMFRGGVTNAAGRGLDIVTNYGPAVQVKHLSLDINMAGEIVESIAVGDIVIVCKTAEAQVIETLLAQIGLGIRGIITQDDLEGWYTLCLGKYPEQIGSELLKKLRDEFAREFPMLNQLAPFLQEREYRIDQLKAPFRLRN